MYDFSYTSFNIVQNQIDHYVYLLCSPSSRTIIIGLWGDLDLSHKEGPFDSIQ